MKLFKKISAAILAGVMALSMVACSGAGVIDPTTPVPEVTPDNATVTSVLKWMNSGRVLENELIDKSNVTESDVDKYKMIENDEKLAAEAQKILDVIAAGKATDVRVSSGSAKLYINKASVFAALGGAPSAEDIRLAISNTSDARYLKVLGSADAVEFIGTTKSNAYTAELDDLKYEDKDVERKALAYFGLHLSKDLKNNTKDTKVGVAAANVNGYTYVLILTKDIKVV